MRPVAVTWHALPPCHVLQAGVAVILVGVWVLALASGVFKPTSAALPSVRTRWRAGSELEGEGAGGGGEGADALGLGYASGAGEDAGDAEMREASAAAVSALEAAEASQGPEGAPAAQSQAADAQPVVTTSLTATASGRLAVDVKPAAAFASGDRSACPCHELCLASPR